MPEIVRIDSRWRQWSDEELTPVDQGDKRLSSTRPAHNDHPVAIPRLVGTAIGWSCGGTTFGGDMRDAYLDAMWTVVTRHHHTRFSWAVLRRICSCGRELPCSVKDDAMKALQRS
jgi:hypothetical protein